MLLSIEPLYMTYFWMSWIIVAGSLTLSYRAKGVLKRLYVFVLIKTLSAMFIHDVLAFWMTDGWLDSPITFLPLYLDWLMTTPLTLWILLGLASFRKELPKITYIKIAILDLLMVLLGLLADAFTGGLRWVFFVLSAGLFSWLVWMLWGPIRRHAAAQISFYYKKFLIITSFTTFAWFLFPLLWLSSPLAFNVLNVDESIRAFLLHNIVTKSGIFVLLLILFRGNWQADDRQQEASPGS